MTRVIVTGDRNWYCRDLADRVVVRLIGCYGSDLVVVHGNYYGVDTAFSRSCRSLLVDQEPHPAHWDKLGNRAGPIRNQQMVDAGANFAIAVHRDLGSSKGTKDCVRRCLAAGIPVWLIDSDRVDAEPVRIRELPSS